MSHLVRGIALGFFAALAVAQQPPILAPAVDGVAELQPGWAHYVAPMFPPTLTNTALLDGYAMVAYTFNEEGIIDDQIVLAASHPAFGEEVLRVMPEWRIRVDAYGARARRDTRTFEFKRRGSIMSGTQRDGARSFFNLAGDQVAASIRTHPEADLDTRLELVAGSFPRFPSELKGYISAGEAVLECIVDADGWVRVPAIVYATNPAFGAAVMSEVHAWRFDPPRILGRTTQASVTRTIQFALRSK